MSSGVRLRCSSIIDPELRVYIYFKKNDLWYSLSKFFVMPKSSKSFATTHVCKSIYQN